MEAFSGKKFKLSCSDNMDAFIEALKFEMADTSQGLPVPDTIEIKKFQDIYVLTTVTPYKTVIQEFRSGKAFTLPSEDDVDKVTITATEQTLHEVIKFKNGRLVVVDYIFTEDDMRIIMNVDRVVAKLMYTPQ